MSEASIILDECRSYAKSGDAAKLDDCCRRLLENYPGELKYIVDAAIAAKSINELDLSEKLCRHIVDIDPTSSFGLYELAIVLNLKGDHLGSIEILERLALAYPSDPRSSLLRARIYYILGIFDKGDKEASISARDKNFAYEAFICNQFGAYIRDNPLTKAVYLSRRNKFASVKTVEERIVRAILQREPFSFVRLGDGEGAFFRMQPDEEKKLFSLYSQNKNDRAKVWFDGTLDLESSGFSNVVSRVQDTIADADIVGLPYESWIRHEYRIASMTGISSLLNILRYIDQARAKFDNTLWCSQSSHTELQRNGGWRRILSHVNKCSLISSHPDAPSVLQQETSIDTVNFLKIPGEKLFESKVGVAATAGVHFPTVFYEILQQINSDLRGEVFLVAGGILGKLYCDRIKKCGGIALDVGSVVDGWVGAATRPHLQAGQMQF